MVFNVFASEAGEGLLALQHVIMAMIVIIISVVIEIRTVIGSCYQGEGPVVVFRVQWFLLNADVMPEGGKKRIIKSHFSLLC